MEQYLALLRGINVGGNNQISMISLKKAFEDYGFSDVRTYINSGNVIFASEEQDIMKLRQACEQIILEAFKMKIAVAVISKADYVDAFSHAPSWWDNDSESKHNAIYVIAPATGDFLVKAIGRNEEYEKVSWYGRVIFWSAPIKTFSKTKWAKIASSASYRHITIRNASTAKKLLSFLN